MKLSKEFSRVPIRIAADSDGSAPPDLGQVAEEVRQMLGEKYNVYPPNLNTAIGQDGSITITAVDQTSGLNLQLQITNMALAAAQSGALPAPPSGGAPPPPGVNPPSTPPPPGGTQPPGGGLPSPAGSRRYRR